MGPNQSVKASWQEFLRALIILSLFLQPALAWKTGYHEQICRKALMQTENSLMEREAFIAGCKAPDLEREAYPPHHLTKDLSRIERYFSLSKENLEIQDYAKSSFYAGILAHYIADLSSPAHNGADPDCHSWIENTTPEILAVEAQRKIIEPKELLVSTANHSKQYAQDLSEYCAKNDTVARDKAMQLFASYSSFNIALMLDSIPEYAPSERTQLESYALTDYPLEESNDKTNPSVLLLLVFLAAAVLIKRKL